MKENLELSTLNLQHHRSRSTMDSIRVSEAPDPGSIPGGTTKAGNYKRLTLKNMRFSRNHCIFST
jgi:hypothetical protein